MRAEAAAFFAAVSCLAVDGLLCNPPLPRFLAVGTSFPSRCPAALAPAAPPMNRDTGRLNCGFLRKRRDGAWMSASPTGGDTKGAPLKSSGHVTRKDSLESKRIVGLDSRRENPERLLGSQRLARATSTIARWAAQPFLGSQRRAAAEKETYEQLAFDSPLSTQEQLRGTSTKFLAEELMTDDGLTLSGSALLEVSPVVNAKDVFFVD